MALDQQRSGECESRQNHTGPQTIHHQEKRDTASIIPVTWSVQDMTHPALNLAEQVWAHRMGRRLAQTPRWNPLRSKTSQPTPHQCCTVPDLRVPSPSRHGSPKHPLPHCVMRPWIKLRLPLRNRARSVLDVVPPAVGTKTTM